MSDIEDDKEELRKYAGSVTEQDCKKWINSKISELQLKLDSLGNQHYLEMSRLSVKGDLIRWKLIKSLIEAPQEHAGSTKPCKQCGESFVYRSEKAEYCSGKCKMRYHRANNS